MPKALRVFLLCSLLSVPFLGFSPAYAAVLTNRGTTCLDVKFANTTNGTPVQAFPCNVTFAQDWNLVGFAIQGIGTSASGGKCLDVSGGGTASGTPVQLFDCLGIFGQQWLYFNNSGFLFNPHSGKCLDVGTGAPFTQATIQACNGSSPGQIWVIR